MKNELEKKAKEATDAVCKMGFGKIDALKNRTKLYILTYLPLFHLHNSR